MVVADGGSQGGGEEVRLLCLGFGFSLDRLARLESVGLVFHLFISVFVFVLRFCVGSCLVGVGRGVRRCVC